MTLDTEDCPQLPVPYSTSSVSDQAIAWFARLRSEDCSAEERLAFHAWLHRTPAHTAAYEEVVALWDDPALRSAAATGASMFVESRELNTRRFLFWLKRGTIAATFAWLMVLIGWELDLPLRLTSEYRTASGEQQVVWLSDGSIVTVNTQSAINTAYDHQRRGVDLLKGEAFFQVAPDTLKPFVVRSSGVETRAVGTAFLVRRESGSIRVTVTEGMVELAPVHHGWKPTQVAAGRQVLITSNGPELPQDVDLGRATAWLRGRLVVEDARLGDVIEELRRYHPGTIQMWNSAISEIRVSGTYDLVDPTAVLLTLTETLPVRMARFTDRVVVLF